MSKYRLPTEQEKIKVPRFEESSGFYTSKQRSKTMAKISGKNSGPERLLRKALWAKNIRFRIHPRNIPGRPDLIIRKYRLVIFVDGDFWHGYQWEQKRAKLKSNRNFWIPKIERNMQRDRHINGVLSDMNLTVMRFWEHQIKSDVSSCVNQVLLYIESARSLNIPTKGIH